MFQQLITISSQAFADGNYNAAYHALAAALQLAAKAEDERQINQVETIAREQLEWIDSHSPEYEHSTRSAGGRNHQSIFALLAQQAAAKLQLITNKHHREN